MVLQKVICVLLACFLLALPLVYTLAEKESSKAIDFSNVELVEAKTVTIESNRRERMEKGEAVKMTSILTGFEGVKSISYQWQMKTGDKWENIEGATESSYCFYASVETLSASYRLVVEYEE